MSVVSIPPYNVEVDGIKWTAVWDDKGNISYEGVDKAGQKVNQTAPSDVIKGAHSYGGGFGKEAENSENKSEGLAKDEFKDTCDGLIIETNNDGTLKSANISEANWTPRQKEFVEKCLQAAQKSEKNEKNSGLKALTPELQALEEKIKREHPELGDLRMVQSDRNPNDVNILRPIGGNKYEAVNKGVLDNYKDEIIAAFNQARERGLIKSKPRGLKESFKSDVISLGKGMVSDFRNAARMVGEMTATPFHLVKDLYKAGKLIGRGKFRELRDRAALKIHDNLEALGVFGEKSQKRINEVNKKIEARLGIKDREKNPNVFARIYGQPVKDVRRSLQALSGRNVQVSLVSGRSGSSNRDKGR